MSRRSIFDSPFLLGFDQFERALDRVSKASTEGYPPYNIEQVGEDRLRITLAVAGFSADGLSVQLEDNQLIVRGRQAEEEKVYLHRGIAARQFQRSFVLADGIVYAKGLGCTTLIDVATLTGAISTTLGSVRFGLFTNNDRLHADLERAATAAGERLWRLPMDREYDELIKSTIADIKNTGTGGAGSIVAAKFIERFVGDTPWAHLDIAGVANTTTEKGVNVRGATGQPVRTLVHYVLGQARR